MPEPSLEERGEIQERGPGWRFSPLPKIDVHLNRNDALTMDTFVEAIRQSCIKDIKPPKVSVIIIGAAFDFKNFLKVRLPDLSRWTDN